MSVTIFPSPQTIGKNTDKVVTTASALFEETSRAWCMAKPRNHSNKRKGPEKRPILHSAFADLGRNAATIIPYQNGFVDTVLRAFNQDLHLVIRPDDVWLAILIQFKYFITGTGTKHLREQLVSHEPITIDLRPYQASKINMSSFAQKMTSVLQKHFKDPDFQAWIIPNFSTTTDNDKSVASIAMLGKSKAYFDYDPKSGCGFPSVTLIGKKSDWQSIRARLDNLSRVDEQTAAWAKLLIPTLDHMVRTFDEPDSQRTIDFWLRAAYEAGKDGSKSFATLSGWLTAFCYWRTDGTRTREKTDEECNSDRSTTSLQDRKRLVLDGVSFPLISPEAIPSGIVTVLLDVYHSDRKVKATMVAGQVGATVNKEGIKVQPRSGWWMLHDRMPWE